MVEAYVGEYASGKSELAINRALELCGKGEMVTLVDLDFVEPFYTLRPLKQMLEGKGLSVIGWGTKDSFGLGETGGRINPSARWVLKRPGHIIMDVGYGVHGAASLNLVEGALDNEELKVWAVINVTRPMTSTVEDIVDYVKNLGRVDGLINNTHLGHETTIDLVLAGWRVVKEAASLLGLPVVYSAVEERLRPEALASELRNQNIKFIRRYMPGAMW